MKLSTKGRYGLRALIDLAVHEDDAVSIQSIAERQGISDSYLEQLVRLLKKAGLVKSIRGAGGGYRLAKPASEISVGDILRALEGNIDAVNCTAFQEETGCQGSDFCVTKSVWKRVNDAISQTVDGIFLEELVQDSKAVLKKTEVKGTDLC
ncbi:MAG: Rrf2 family transcriptional regulator [Lachnospiraceae bacterium]|nr:Rrf2 family transcriptional regulator [Lachnospiraceae bacterium]